MLIKTLVMLGLLFAGIAVLCCLFIKDCRRYKAKGQGGKADE